MRAMPTLWRVLVKDLVLDASLSWAWWSALHRARFLAFARRYPAETVRRVQFIKRAQELGFSLKEITELLSLRATPETPCADIRTRALGKITAIEEKIRVLHAMKHALAQLVAECSGQGEIMDCPILASLDTEGELQKSAPLKG